MRSDLAEEIRRDLTKEYPTLHLLVERGAVHVRGTFPVLGADGRALDRFQVSIDLPPGYPRVLPVVRETGGRIPWTLERHVQPDDGTACVLLPDERWRVFPVGAPFLDYVKGPLHTYFLGQLMVERGEPWPFGEWGHGGQGILEYYQELLGTRDPTCVARWVYELARQRVKGHRACPCGRGKAISDCCNDRLRDLRSKIDRTTARRSLRELLASPSVQRAPTTAELRGAAGSSRGLT
jgi:hypothetical protein